MVLSVYMYFEVPTNGQFSKKPVSGSQLALVKPTYLFYGSQLALRYAKRPVCRSQDPDSSFKDLYAALANLRVAIRPVCCSRSELSSKNLTKDLCVAPN